MNKLSVKVTNATLDGFASSVIGEFKKDANAAKNAFVKKQMTALEETQKAMNAAILQSKDYSTLVEKDSARDSAFTAARKITEAYAVFPIPAKQAANAPIKALFDKYVKADLTGAAYKAESSLIASFRADLEAHAEAIASLEGLKEALDALWSAEDAFVEANAAYVKSQNAKGVSATSLRKPLLEIINEKLVPYLYAMIISEDADCTAFASFFAKEIERTNASAQQQPKAVSQQQQPQQPEADSQQPQADSQNKQNGAKK